MVRGYGGEEEGQTDFGGIWKDLGVDEVLWGWNGWLGMFLFFMEVDSATILF